MKIKKKALYLSATVLTAYVLYNMFHQNSIKKIVVQLKQCRPHYVILAILAHLINHGLRAYRWKMLLKAQGDAPPLRQAYYAEMTGFFTNSIFLRVGDIARCNALQKMRGTPVKRSLGTVVVERFIDFLFFFALLGGALFFYFQGLKETLSILGKEANKTIETSITAIRDMGMIEWFIVLFFTITVCYTAFILFENFKKRIKMFFKELIASTKSAINSTSSKFWIVTALTWAFYFLLEYFCFFALESTAQATKTHGLLPVIAVFTALQLSHLIPSIGQGAGIYHILISNTLLCFGVSKEAALAYAIITHGIQLFNGLIVGGLCTLQVFLTTSTPRRKVKEVA